ncbi:MAG: histidinol-phosphate transaminase [Clostridia bacterium]|nr:histidinol-phosphate transaminase [Clostridia bacterium]MDE7329136.1 histidinol-phosphate transaminase [Clostridia bacterium]
MNYLSKLCRSIQPYMAGEQPQDKKYVKLNTNENPYPPCPGVAEFIKDFDSEKLKLYPDPNNTALVNKIAKRHGLKPSNVFVGNGSDEVLALCFPTFFDKDGGGVAYSDVTYSFYKVWAKTFEIPSNVIPLMDDFRFDVSEFKQAKCQGMIICNPNAPTGLIVNRLDLRSIIEANPEKIIIIDEAYADFCNCSMANYVSRYPNLLIVRTFSKSYSLAGARCGYALGNEVLIRGLKTIKDSFNSYTVNRFTEGVAIKALEDVNYFNDQVDRIIATRDKYADELRAIGFDVLPSSTNFLFAKHNVIAASELYYQLKKNGVLVRHFNASRVDAYLRITVGSEDEMAKLVIAVKKIIADSQKQ